MESTESSSEQLQSAQRQLKETCEKEAVVRSMADVSTKAKMEAENMLKVVMNIVHCDNQGLNPEHCNATMLCFVTLFFKRTRQLTIPP
jgi:hypothetical protein